MNNKNGSQPNTPLKEFNSTPIDTPTPVSLGDNLEPSKSLEPESLSIEDPNPELTPEPQVPLEPQVEPLVESEVKDTLISEPEPEIKLESVTEPSTEPKIELDQESEVKPLSEVESQSNPNLELNLEKEIQSQPETEVELKPEPDLETKLDSEYNPDPVTTIQTDNNPPSPISEDPEVVKQKIEEVLSYNSANNVVNSKSDKPKTSALLKTLFTLSLIIFIGVVIGLAYFLLNPSQKTNLETKTTPTDTPVQSNITCELNGFIYSLNQSFPSADGCNTCTCVSADNIECTEKICGDVTITPATKSAANLTITPISTNKAGLNADSYIGKTPFDPEKVKVGDIVLSNGKVYEKTTNKYGFTNIHTIPVLNGIEVEGSGNYFIFDKNNKVVCEGLPCCDDGSKDIAAIWQEEWCTGY